MHGPVNGPRLGRQFVANALAVGLGLCCQPEPGMCICIHVYMLRCIYICIYVFNPLNFRPELRQEHPLNLSISISGGKETNKDFPSNGE